MKQRLPYTPARIYVDGLVGLREGDYIVASAKTGYLVQSIRPSPSIPFRRYLGTLRWPPAEIPADARVHRIYWYRRARKRIASAP